MTSSIVEVSSYFINPYVLPILVTAIFLQCLGISIVLSEQGSTISFIFSLMASGVNVWLFSITMVMSSATRSVAIFWAHIVFAGVCFIPVVLLTYVIHVAGKTDEQKHLIWITAGVSSIFFLAVFLTDDMVLGVYEYWWGFFPRYGWLGLVYITYFTGILLLNLKLLWDYWTDARTVMGRKRLGSFFLAYLVASPGSVDFLPAYGVEIFPIGFVFVMLFSLVLAWSIWRYRISDFSPAYAAQEVFSTMDDPLIVFDLGGTIRMVNDACETILNYSRDELIDASFDRLLAPHELGSSKHEAILRGEIKDDEEVKLNTRDGAIVDVRLSTTQLTDTGGNQAGVVVLARDIRDRKQAREQIQQLAFHHPVTDLPNRRYFFDKINLEDDGGPSEASLLFMTLPDFREIKNSLGPRNIENLLEKLAGRFEPLVDGDVELIHWNENEFILLDQTSGTVQAAEQLANRWARTLEESFIIEGESFDLNANIGIALKPKHGLDATDLINKADLAQNHMDQPAENNVQFYEEGMHQEVGQRFKIKHDLRQALNDEELYLCYHPVFSSQEEEITQLEALLRWEHGSEGFVDPPEIITMAEELGVMPELGQFIFREALEDLARIDSALDRNLDISINLSARQLHNTTSLVSTIDSVLDRTGVNPTSLMFEITESTAMEDVEHSKQIIGSLQDQGCRVAVDDFGTGYSSLQYLMELPVDCLKIDKSFVLNLFETPDYRTLVETTIFMGHQLDMKIIAEGVETPSHRDFLEQNNCDYLQGFLWTQPLPAGECIEYLQGWPQGSPAS